MTLFTETFATPFGPFSVAVAPTHAVSSTRTVAPTHAVVATAFGSLSALQRRLPTLPQCHIMYDISATAPVREQVLAYLAGERRDFDLPLAPVGTTFQQRVWSALRRIRYGETRSYRDLATALGNPGASRAVGRANATNPICLIVPCHRVIGADGSLTGFAFGEDLKRRLLDLEGASRLRPALV